MAIKVNSLFGLQLFLKTGSEGKPTVFLFADTQIKDESFMEDISMILNTGDVPNLFAQDEKAELIEKMQAVARQEVRYQGHAGPYINVLTELEMTSDA